jgi:hypothetical protein
MFKLRRMRWAGHVTRMGRRGIGFWWESQKKRDPLGRPSRRMDSIKENIREIGWGSMDWIHLAKDREQLMALAHTVMNLRIP